VIERDLSHLPLAQIGRAIRETVRGGAEIEITGHAVKAAKDDDVSLMEITNALRSCTVTRSELHGKHWRYTCLGGTSTGQRLEMAVRLFAKPDRVTVITIYVLKRSY
jgi:hypothetical protein